MVQTNLPDFGPATQRVIARMYRRSDGRQVHPEFLGPSGREDWRLGRADSWSDADEARLIEAIKREARNRDRVTRHGPVFLETVNPRDLVIAFDSDGPRPQAIDPFDD